MRCHQALDSLPGCRPDTSAHAIILTRPRVARTDGLISRPIRPIRKGLPFALPHGPLARKLLALGGIVDNQLTVLRGMRERWIAEYPDVADTDPVRAAHHAEAIADLGGLIARLTRISAETAKQLEAAGLRGLCSERGGARLRLVRPD